MSESKQTLEFQYREFLNPVGGYSDTSFVAASGEIEAWNDYQSYNGNLSLSDYNKIVSLEFYIHSEEDKQRALEKLESIIKAAQGLQVSMAKYEVKSVDV